jgi:hypothetical protein
MRFAFITGAALTMLVSGSVAYAQNNQAPPARHAERQYETFWPTAAQEAAIPCRPCELAMGWRNRRLICWNP